MIILQGRIVLDYRITRGLKLNTSSKTAFMEELCRGLKNR